MLFQSVSKNAVQEVYRKAVLASNRVRKDDAARKIDYYNNMQTEHILEHIARKYAKPEKLTPVYLNIVRKIVRALAYVYMQDATRTITGSKSDQDIFAEAEHIAALPVKMKQANRYSRLLGNVLLRVLWRNGKLDLDILTPNYIDVATGDSPEDVHSVLITHSPESGRANEIEYSLWTADEYQRLNYLGATIETEPNPYGVLPFLFVWSEPPTDAFWLPGANDLISVQDAINDRLVQLCYTMAFQSFGMGYVKGAVAPNHPTESGPGSMMFLPENGEVGFASPNAPIDETVNAIEFLMKQAAVTNGLSASSLSSEPSEESGIAKLVGNAELEERRRDDIALFARYEHQLFDLIRIVWNYHNTERQISESAEFAVNFYDPTPTVSGYEQAREWDLLMDKGLISPVDIMLERDPDLSNREEAKERLREIQAEIKEFSPDSSYDSLENLYWQKKSQQQAVEPEQAGLDEEDDEQTRQPGVKGGIAS